MRVLLDTHILLWALADQGKLPRAARALLEDPETDILFSAASIWEIAIKARVGRLALQVKPAEIAKAAADSGMVELPVRSSAGAMVAELPDHHRDPFDRILIAQAIAEPAKLCTADKVLSAYGRLVQLV